MSLQAWKKDLRALQGVNLRKVDATLKAARGIIDDDQIDRVIEFREASFELFEQGNSAASMWAGQAMWEAANFLNAGLSERLAIRAGRKIIKNSAEGNAMKAACAKEKHMRWQKLADEKWALAEHRTKTAAAIARIVAKAVGANPNTIRRAIKKPVIAGRSD
ncbi:MAG: hypothetical protein QM795_07710 [Pseudoxanthomonas sp.]